MSAKSDPQVMKQNAFAALVATLLLLGRLLLPGQEVVPGELSLNEAVKLALERNPELLAARNSIEMAEGDVVTAGLRPNPQFTVESEGLSYYRSGIEPSFEGRELTAGVEYEIQRRSQRRLGRRAAQFSTVRETAAFEDAARALRLEVRSAFYRVLLADSNRRLAQTTLDQTDQVIALNRTRFEQGEISGLELTRIEVERLRFADDLFQARLELQNSKAALLALLNAPDLGARLNVRGDLREIPRLGVPMNATAEEFLQMATDRRPDLQAAVAEFERSAAEILFQRTLATPNITVAGGYMREGQDNKLVAGVNIPLAVFNRNQGEILRSKAETRQAQNLLTATRNRIALEVWQAFNAVKINGERVEYIQSQQIRQAEEASRVTLAAYRLGGAPLMNYLDAQRRYRDTMRVLNQALFDERASMFELAAAVGDVPVP
ncbi:MAG: TolC family protein [Bryobacterales bacterium]|nr:TolC family protein [Bryobacterales bacterium]